MSVGEDKMPPMVLPFTQAPPMAELDEAIAELDAMCDVRLTFPAVPVPSRARVDTTVGRVDHGRVDAAVRE